MYENLKNEMFRKGITNKAVADLISCTEKSAYNKLCGATDFSVQEALLISQNLFPEFDMNYLFRRSA